MSLPPQNAASPLAGARGHHVGLRVADFEGAERWYVEKLDFRPGDGGASGEIRFRFLHPPTDDGFRIELVGGGAPTPAPLPEDFAASLGTTGFHHLCLAVDDVDRAVEALRLRDVAVLAGPFENASVGLRLAFVADPWGNVIELAQALAPLRDPILR